MNVTVTSNDLLKKSIEFRVSLNCTIERLKTATKKELGLREDAADFFLFYGAMCLNDHPKETKLVDLEFDHTFELYMEYPTAGKISDKFVPSDPVVIKSDEVRKIVVPHNLGRSPGKYWDDCEINSTEGRFQLSSSGFLGQKLILWIEDPTQSKKPGTCRTRAFKLPRSTRKVLVRKDAENPNIFNLYCELQTGPEKVIKDGDWTFADRPGPNGNISEWGEWDVKFIKFSEGIVRSFLDSDQKREPLYDKIVKPLVKPLAQAGVEAAVSLI